MKLWCHDEFLNIYSLFLVGWASGDLLLLSIFNLQFASVVFLFSIYFKCIYGSWFFPICNGSVNLDKRVFDKQLWLIGETVYAGNPSSWSVSLCGELCTSWVHLPSGSSFGSASETSRRCSKWRGRVKLWDMYFFFSWSKLVFMDVRLVELHEAPHSEGLYAWFNTLKSMSWNS